VIEFFKKYMPSAWCWRSWRFSSYAWTPADLFVYAALMPPPIIFWRPISFGRGNWPKLLISAANVKAAPLQ
jgi:hypothetical protein